MCKVEKKDFCKNYSDAFVKGSVSSHEKTSQHEKSKEQKEKGKCEINGLPSRKSAYQGKTIII